MDTSPTISISCDTLTEFVDNADESVPPTAEPELIIVVGRPTAETVLPVNGSTSESAKKPDPLTGSP